MLSIVIFTNFAWMLVIIIGCCVYWVVVKLLTIIYNYIYIERDLVILYFFLNVTLNKQISLSSSSLSLFGFPIVASYVMTLCFIKCTQSLSRQSITVSLLIITNHIINQVFRHSIGYTLFQSNKNNMSVFKFSNI